MRKTNKSIDMSNDTDTSMNGLIVYRLNCTNKATIRKIAMNVKPAIAG
jgi:hypothetical protein